MREYIYVDSQGVVLANGQTANVELEYDEATDRFVVTADCENWINDYIYFNKEYYPEETIDEELINDGRDACKFISGKYFTLKEINERLERFCNPGDWYEFTWEYEDGTPVE